MTRQRNRITRKSAARLLDDPGSDTTDPLSTVLGAATVRSTTAELPGEAAAMAQFSALSTRELVPSTESESFMSKLQSKALAAPIATLGAIGLTIAGGGVALAAATNGHVPFAGHDHRSSHAPSAPASTNPGQSGHATTTPSATPMPKVHPGAAPNPSLVGLCHAYLAGSKSHGKRLSSPAFTALTTAVGGTVNVTPYCTALLANKTHPAHPVKPTQAATPTHPAHPAHPVKPTQAATPTHPAHPVKPTQAATPTHPAHPVKPTQAATPTHPAHPVKPAHPAH